MTNSNYVEAIIFNFSITLIQTHTVKLNLFNVVENKIRMNTLLLFFH